MDLLLLKGFKDESWRRQIGIQFQHLCSTCLHKSVIANADDPMSLFTSILKDIAEETKTSALPKRFHKPWFSHICKDAVKERNSALERFKC